METTDQKLRRLFCARVGMPANVSKRHEAASRNELATDIAAAEDCIDPRSASGLEYISGLARAINNNRAVGFVEVKGEEPDPFDYDWDGGTR